MSKIQINCQWCNKPFLTWRYRKRKFCSNSCGANSRMSDPEYKKKLYTEERNKKVGDSQRTRILHKKQCPWCKEWFSTYSKRDDKTCSLSCAAKLRMSDEKNRQRISETLTGRPGVKHTEETKRQISETLKAKPQFSEERIQHISDGLFKSFIDGTWKPYTGFFQGCYYGHFYDSSYELARFMQLDDLKQCYTKRHSIRIKYTINEQNRWYYPDILVGSVLEEIKPLSRVASKENQAKFLAAQEYCRQNNLTFKIITEKDLSEYIEKARNYHKSHHTMNKEEVTC